MSELSLQNGNDGIARNLPGSSVKLPGMTARAKITWEGRDVPMVLEGGIWRARKRTKELKVDIATGTGDLTIAKRIVRAELESKKTLKVDPARGTMEALVRVYLGMAKKVSGEVAEANVQRLRSIVKTARGGKSLLQVPVGDFPRL